MNHIKISQVAAHIGYAIGVLEGSARLAESDAGRVCCQSAADGLKSIDLLELFGKSEQLPDTLTLIEIKTACKEWRHSRPYPMTAQEDHLSELAFVAGANWRKQYPEEGCKDE